MQTKFAQLSLFLTLSVFGPGEFAVSQDDSGPSIKVQDKAKVGAWTISKLKKKGDPPYAMMSRDYEDGKILRYFLGESVSSLMIFDMEASRALSDSGGSLEGVMWFSDSGGDTPPLDVVFSWTNELTSEQDALVTVDTSEINDILAALAQSDWLNLNVNGYTVNFDLKGSQSAADELLKYAFPSAGASVPAPSEELEGEKIVLGPTDTSVVWDLSLPGGQSAVYQIQGAKGQKIKIAYIEDTGMGQVDVGNASVEEGGDNGLTIGYESDRFQRVDVTNPSARKMEFRIFLSME